MNIKKEIEEYINKCKECEKTFASDGRYGNAIYEQGAVYAYERVLRLLKETEMIKSFSWNDVNLDDEVELGNGVKGKVSALYYTEKGFSGMRVQYENWTVVYEDDEYKNFKRIGDWVNYED